MSTRGTPTIAVLGARGAVGRLVAAAAVASGTARLRLGVRDPADPPPVTGHGCTTQAVQPRDPASLTGFLDGADLLINCLGPGYRTRGQLAAAAAAMGLGYLDPNGDDAIHTRIEAATRDFDNTAIVTGAGAVPGAFGLLGRWLAAGGPGPVRHLRGYLVTMEPMHAGTAAEFLLGILATGRSTQGAQAGPVPPRTGLRLPYVDSELVGYPLVTTESDALVADLGAPSAAFFHAFEAGGASLRQLNSLGHLVRAGRSVRDIAAGFAAAVNAEFGQRSPVQVIAMQAGWPECARSVVLRSSSSYRVTAAVLLAAATAMLEGRVPPGVHRADILDPDLVTRLSTVDSDIRLESHDGDLDSWPHR